MNANQRRYGNPSRACSQQFLPQGVLTVIAGLLLWPASTSAAVLQVEELVDSVIPDGDPAGLVSYMPIFGGAPEITKVTVTLELSGGFNGDLYVHLSHDSGFAVLLNRVGRTAEEPLGYLDAGLSVTFDDQAIQGDIHRYRETLGGPVLNGPLTGAWQPDGRTTLPTMTVASDLRGASLAGFRGLDPKGQWTLVVADFGGGGEATLVKWGLTITTVPEPQSVGVAAAGGLLVSGWLVRRKGARKERG
jgi:subtilisin-like proprotein convertase family protein